ncbi:MAG: hypothetical protein JW963_20550 [Anaerolineales bacterium]|nr:hypothetical protein [Anaerolineales bacterium]
MMYRWLKGVLLVLVAATLFAISMLAPDRNAAKAQQPTGSVPTVTGTVSGPLVTVYADLEQIDVYAGPSTYEYPAVGVLLASQSVPALGRASDENWIQVFYPGVPGSTAWVYAPYVRISPGARLQTVDAPPTPTPFSTPIINPTLAAAFVTPVTPTRLPTFTPAAQVVVPTFVDEDQNRANRIPVGLLIFSLGFIGALGALISFLRGR